MTRVETEYCVQCGRLDRAVDVQRAGPAEYGRGVDGVELVSGDGGISEEATDELPVDGIVAAVGEHVRATT